MPDRMTKRSKRIEIQEVKLPKLEAIFCIFRKENFLTPNQSCFLMFFDSIKILDLKSHVHCVTHSYGEKLTYNDKKIIMPNPLPWPSTRVKKLFRFLKRCCEFLCFGLTVRRGYVETS